jgi:hypothetical protein
VDVSLSQPYLYLSLESGASFEANNVGSGVEIVLVETSGAGEWRSALRLDVGYARRLRDWLVENVHG